MPCKIEGGLKIAEIETIQSNHYSKRSHQCNSAHGWTSCSGCRTHFCGSSTINLWGKSALLAQACSLADRRLDTCPGDNLCAAKGLNDLICSTPEAYQQKAIELSRHPAELQRLRRHLLDHHDELPLFDTAAWVAHFEQLLEQLLA